MSDSVNDIRELEKKRLAKEKELINELEYRENVMKLSIRKNRSIYIKLALAIIDLVLIGIVIYGNKNYVYAGFPKFVPWLIAGLFGVMFVIRATGVIREIMAPKNEEK